MLGQSAYASKLLERSGMAECKPCVSPMEERLKLTKASSAAKEMQYSIGASSAVCVT